MCGIAGFRILGEGGASPSELGEALQALQHRGPDDSGQWTSDDGRAGLGQRRLSIVDLSAFGHQPMTSACGQWIMVFNGEVYNFRELRGQLEALGHRFQGTGDSEVILGAISQWGVAAVERFIGMFAIALWHRPTGALHLLRDRLGVKPLYYHWDGRRLLFASELKALHAFEGWRPEVDLDAMGDFLRYGYVDEPRAIYRQVHKVPPAHHLVLQSDGKLALQRYWHPLKSVGLRHGRDEDALADELEALLVDACRYRMIADVPVGVNHVLTRQNVSLLRGTAARVRALGAREMQLLRYKPAGRAASLDYLARRLRPDDLATLGDDVRHLASWGGEGFSVRIDCALVPLLADVLGEAEQLTRFGVFGCEAGRHLGAVKPDGTTAGCSFVTAAEGSEGAFRGYADDPDAPCRDCDLRAVCRGGCKVVSLHLEGRIGADPECPRVRRARGRA